MRKLLSCAAMLLALHRGFAHAQPPLLPNVQISTCSELQGINSNLSGKYDLANDIDCSGFDFGDGKGFMPLGNATAAFTGTFDGKGFAISNVFINRPEIDNVGVFGLAGSYDNSAQADISHVTVTGFDITGRKVVGGLFGQLSYSSATDVHTDGTVHGETAVGGLGGVSRYSTITNASSSGSVYGDHNGTDSNKIAYGGLIGANGRGRISCSSSSASVTGNYKIGGLVGDNVSGTISSSFATGAVDGFWRVGGLAGENVSGTIANCFATGAVNGEQEVGGLVGLQYLDSVYGDGSNPIIKNSYATGEVTGGVNTKGILGLLYNSGTCADNYWDVTTSGVSTDGCGSSGRTTAEMQMQSTFVGWDFDAVWTMNGYPELQLQCAQVPSVQHTVTPTAGTGGSISPNSPQTVNDGATASFTVLSDSGYKIDTVEGCGGTLSGNTYTTAPVTADCTVTATFTGAITHTVIPRDGIGGFISPTKRQHVLHGSTISFTIIPRLGYDIKSVSGCGGTLSGNIYTTGPITNKCIVKASFEKNGLARPRYHLVFPRAGRHGSISPSERQHVAHNASISFTVTPDSGYYIRNVTGCDGFLNGNTYTTGLVTRTCMVNASFRRN